MMKDGIGIRLMEAGDSLVFSEHWTEAPFPQVALGSRSDECHHPGILVVFQHGHFGFAAPAP